MTTRREFLLGGWAALGATCFTSAASADNAKGTRVNLGEEMVRHANWYMHGNNVNAIALQSSVSLDSWDAQEIADAFAQSWEHMKSHDSEAVQDVIDDFQNNGGRRFYDALVNHDGRRIAQSVPDFVSNMVRKDTIKAINAPRVGRDFDKVFDAKIQAVILNAREGKLDADQINEFLQTAHDQWQEGFALFKEQTLIPQLSGNAPDSAPSAAAPAVPEL